MVCNLISRPKTVLKNKDFEIKVEMVLESPFFHLEVYNWSVSIYKRLIAIFKSLLKLFKERGIDKVYILIPNDDPKLLKFEKMFGFSIEQEYQDLYLMSRGVAWE